MTSVEPPHDPDLSRPPLPAMLTQADLARRWRITTRTLDRWRIAETGPVWLLLNGTVRYRSEDVLTFERARTRQPNP